MAYNFEIYRDKAGELKMRFSFFFEIVVSETDDAPAGLAMKAAHTITTPEVRTTTGYAPGGG